PRRTTNSSSPRPNPLTRAENTYPLPILLNTSPTSPLFSKRTNGSRVESCCHSYSVDSAICCANGIEEGQRPSSSVKRLLHCIGYAALPCPASDDTSNPPSTIATRNSAGTSPSRCP